MSETAPNDTSPVQAKSTVSRELAVTRQGSAAVPMPSNFEQMTKFASLMAEGANMVGPAFRDNPGACLGALIQAMRWGMDPYSCSQKMYIASRGGEGPIAYEAQLVHAVLLKNAPLTKRPRFRYDGEGDTRRCIVTLHIEGEDEPIEHESPQIGKITVKNSPLWKADPDQQLAYYTIRAAARRHFPDVIMGVYTPDEVAQISETRAVEERIVTLSGGAVNAASEGEQPREAEFTDVSKVIEKKARKATTAKKDKPADPPAEAEAQPPAQPAAETPADPEDPTDEEIVAGVEAKMKDAKGPAASQPIRENRGALERIRETTDDNALRSRAHKLLEMYELDD